MSTFKIKDLMINLGSDKDADLNRLNYRCVAQTEHTPCMRTFPDFGLTTTMTPIIFPLIIENYFTNPYYLNNPIAKDFAVLRAQLKQQLELLDQQEKEQEAQLKPQTLEEAEQLEHKMKEALAEVQKIKEGFKKK